MIQADDPADHGEGADDTIGALKRRIAQFAHPDPKLGIGQIASSFLPLIAILALMYACLPWSPIATLALAIPAAGFVVRIFIIQHDCGHGSYFKSRRRNDLLGLACSLITLTPYHNWRRQHAGHHKVWNNLDHRETGADIYSTCLTTAEYAAMSRGARFRYRLLRHPTVALLLLPPLVFLLLYRLPFDTPAAWSLERRSVYWTNAALILLYGGLGVALGFRALLMVQLPVTILSSIIGVWLFSVQHRFERTHWDRARNWHPDRAALEGSSYLALPRLLQWFTGHIGFHHLHHLHPRIPNYRLEACFKAVPTLGCRPLRLVAALGAFRYAVWDENRGLMVRFAEVEPG